MSWSGLVRRLVGSEEEDGGGVVREVRQRGFAVVDDAWSPADVALLRSEIEALHASDSMEPNQVQFATASGPIRLTKPGIFEADMHHQQRRSACPAFDKLFHSVGAVQRPFAGTFDVALEPSTHNAEQQQEEGKKGLAQQQEQDGSAGKDKEEPQKPNTDAGAPTRSFSTFTLKLQYNDGTGGCFPYHYDNPAPPNKRILTMLVYLNPDWQQGDGGEIMLLPFLGKPEVIPPAGNRTVIFRSDTVLHRVLQANKPRCCFTLWMDGNNANADDTVYLREKHLTTDFIPSLVTSPLQRTLSRAVYQEEYERSLHECFSASARDAKYAVALHRAHLKQILSNDKLRQFVQQLKLARKW